MFHILVVEDDQALNKLICRVLNKNGYETSAAFDGEQALEMLRFFLPPITTVDRSQTV